MCFDFEYVVLLSNYDIRNRAKGKILFAEIEKVHLAAQDDRKHLTHHALVLLHVFF